MKKLALGTAQFGMSYGIANQHGKIKLENIKDIIKIAREKNIDLVDKEEFYTYGYEYYVLGKILCFRES